MVSEIGFGAWGIGGRTAGATSYGTTDDGVSRAALAAALDHGITFFDTSNVYGDGHSEALIGEVFASRRDKVVIATKAGLRNFRDPADFSAPALRDSLTRSLRRLRTDYVDILQLHNPTEAAFGCASEIRDCLEAMKSEGLIRAFGSSLKAPDSGIAAMDELGAATLQVNLNMLDPRAIDSGLLAVTAQRGVGIVARTPLCFGFLSGKIDETTAFGEDDHRSRWPRDQLIRWSRAAKSIFSRLRCPENQSPGDMALRFCLSFPEVSTVIPGMMTPQEVVSNAAVSDYGGLNSHDIDIVADVNKDMAKPTAGP